MSLSHRFPPSQQIVVGREGIGRRHVRSRSFCLARASKRETGICVGLDRNLEEPGQTVDRLFSVAGIGINRRLLAIDRLSDFCSSSQNRALPSAVHTI